MINPKVPLLRYLNIRAAQYMYFPDFQIFLLNAIHLLNLALSCIVNINKIKY